MTLTKMIAATAAVAVLATSAVSGGLEIPEERPEITIIDPPSAPTGGSLPGWVIPAVIVAALIGVASQEDDSGTAADNSDPS